MASVEISLIVVCMSSYEEKGGGKYQQYIYIYIYIYIWARAYELTSVTKTNRKQHFIPKNGHPTKRFISSNSTVL